MFECPRLQTDVNYLSSQCGSNELNQPSILYIVSLVLTFCLLFYLLYRRTSKLSILLKGQVDEWWTFANAYLNPSLCTYKKNLLHEKRTSFALNQDHKIYNTKLMLDFLERTFSACFCLCFVYFIALITYVTMKTGPRRGEYSLFSYQYFYAATSVYLKSTSSGIMMIIYLFISGFISLLMLSALKPLSNHKQVSDSKQQQYSQQESGSKYEQIFKVISIQVINLLLSVVGNGLYVYGLVFFTMGYIPYDNRLQFMLVIMTIQGFISLFRLLNISIIIPYLVHRLPTSNSFKQMSHVFMNLMDVIIIPLSAIIITFPNCTNYIMALGNRLDIIMDFNIPLNTISCEPKYLEIYS